MKRKMLALVLAVVAATGIGGSNTSADAAQETFVVIGGGAKGGVYHQVALGICTLINEKLGGQGYTCKAQPSEGSTTNINVMSRGWLDFAVVQSDHNWQAYHGEKGWKGKPYTGLRSVFSIYPETVMLVTRADSGIQSVTDLRGKRVNIGLRGSGRLGNAKDILKIYGIDWRDDISARDLEPQEAARALRRGKIDAFFYTVGNPWDGGLALAEDVKIRMIPIDAPGIKKLVADHPYYVLTAIPGGIYKGVGKAVPTYAVKAVLVTSDKASDEVVYNVVKTVFENLDRFRTMHPAFQSIQPQGMLEGLSAPLHPGALRYYKEKGWM